MLQREGCVIPRHAKAQHTVGARTRQTGCALQVDGSDALEQLGARCGFGDQCGQFLLQRARRFGKFRLAFQWREKIERLQLGFADAVQQLP